MKTLSEVCTIQTGFTTRGRLESAADGGVLALQLRDILPNGLIAVNGLIRVQVECRFGTVSSTPWRCRLSFSGRAKHSRRYG